MVEESDGKQKNGNISISKNLLIASLIVAILIIVFVGLLAGLLGKNYYKCEENEDSNASVTNNSASSSLVGPWKNVRLPKTLLPSHYVVDLKPFLNNVYFFEGESEVTFTVMEETIYIIINSKQLLYRHVSVTSENGSDVDIKKHWLPVGTDYLVVELEETMEKHKNYTLKTTFGGDLRDDSVGLYRVSYVNSSNHKITMAATQMQSVYARNVFPCFDEPALKATFDIYLQYQPPNYALSNMPVEHTEKLGKWNRSKFKRTPIMSTYLLAFVVCDFRFAEASTSGSPKIQTNIYARPDQIKAGNAEYAKTITPRILDFYAEFFHVDYPLPKSDQIALPELSLGAMENWGLVTYKEELLLHNPSLNSEASKLRTAEVIAHELTHQWFGNLVSPSWWNELWLNEGFASFVEYIGINEVEPSWRMMDQFVVRDLHRAMNMDGLLSSHPIVSPNIGTEAQINSLFDAISYAKGGCILRMIKHFIGEDAFRFGLKNYLTANAYGSVDHNKLFEHWQAAVDNTRAAVNPPGGFADAMKTWILQMGLPVISVERHWSNPGQVVVRQERFLIDPYADPTQPESDFKYFWTVPFWYLKENDENTTLEWLKGDEALVIDVPESEYIIGNYEAYGYYRVNYDQDNWRKIIRQLFHNFETINVKSRGQIVDDAFNLARAKKLDYETVFNLTQFLREDYDFIPWKSAVDQLKYLTKMLSRSKVFAVYSEFLLHLVDPVYQDLAWTEDNNHLRILQQTNIIEFACTYGNKHCIENVTTRFQEWMSRPHNNPISPNLRQPIYCHAVANGGFAEWDLVWQKYINETDTQEKDALQTALTCTRTSLLIERLLHSLANGSFTTTQEMPRILIELCGNDYAREMVWDFLLEEWDYIHVAYDRSLFALKRLIHACTSSFSTEVELEDLKYIIENNANTLGSARISFQQAIEQTKTNIQWRSDNEDVIQNWLQNVFERH